MADLTAYQTLYRDCMSSLMSGKTELTSASAYSSDWAAFQYAKLNPVKIDLQMTHNQEVKQKENKMNVYQVVVTYEIEEDGVKKTKKVISAKDLLASSEMEAALKAGVFHGEEIDEETPYKVTIHQIG